MPNLFLKRSRMPSPQKPEVGAESIVDLGCFSKVRFGSCRVVCSACHISEGHVEPVHVATLLGRSSTVEPHTVGRPGINVRVVQAIAIAVKAI